MPNSNNKQAAFIVLSSLGIASLFASFAGNLEPYRVYSQESESLLGKSSRVFILSGNGQKPRELNVSKAVVVDEMLTDYSIQKMLLLGGAIASSSLALIFSNIDFESLEVSQELQQTEIEAKKQLQSEAIKHKYALMSRAQQELFRAELEALLEVSGDDSYDAGEVLVSDKFLNCQYMVQEGHSLDQAIGATWLVAPGTREHSLQKLAFEQWQRGEQPQQIDLSRYQEDN